MSLLLVLLIVVVVIALAAGGYGYTSSPRWGNNHFSVVGAVIALAVLLILLDLIGVIHL